MKQHFVSFFSPGTLFYEETTKPIDSWDIELATKMSKKIVERYGAKPFAFQFFTRERSDDELDSRIVKRSCNYFLGGVVFTLEEVKKNMPEEKVLISNMECNNISRVIVQCNSYKTINKFMDDDILLSID